jgi:hypothetical protein
MVKHPIRLVLVFSAAFLLIACGVQSPEIKPVAQASFSKSMSLSLSPAVQCSNVATIAAGTYHTVGLKENGTVVAVGAVGDPNQNLGQLNVSTPEWTNIKAIAAGTYHTVGLKEDGTVVTAGDNGHNQRNVSSWTNIKAIAAGPYHTVGLKEDGTVVAAGDTNAAWLKVSTWTDIKAIAAGRYHTVGLTKDGTVVTAGDNGQLDASSWTNIKAIAAGWYHTVGLKEDGTVVAVGDTANGVYDYGQLDVSSWTGIKAIAAGKYHTVGIKQEDGTVVPTGANGSGQLAVLTWTNIKAIAAGGNQTIGLTGDGTVATAGSNYYHQLDVSPLFTDIMPICEPAGAANQDVTPPVTISMMTGTLGDNGWYVSDVQMTLNATDNNGGSGVKEIHYTVDDTDTETVVQGSSASQLIASDGSHAVTFYAIDNAGNKETPQKMSINIDKTSPSISANSAILWPPNHKIVNVLIGGSAADDGSGIASTIITVTDEYGKYNYTVTGFGSTIPLEAWRESTDMDGRSYTITAVTTDMAGKQSATTATVLVPHDMR